MSTDDIGLFLSTETAAGGGQETRSYGYDFWDFQQDASVTATYPDRGELLGLAYLTAGLASEAGEVAGKVAKGFRDARGSFDQERIDAIGKELGDILWFVAEMCTHLNLSMADVAVGNTCKLRDRMQRGVLGGDGDDR
jgi:NTP pyrophosphatase (non-canonical NTP hydrolase)